MSRSHARKLTSIPPVMAARSFCDLDTEFAACALARCHVSARAECPASKHAFLMNLLLSRSVGRLDLGLRWECNEDQSVVSLMD